MNSVRLRVFGLAIRVLGVRVNRSVAMMNIPSFGSRDLMSFSNK